MTKQDVLMYLKSVVQPSRVAFGSVEERKFIPIDTIPSKMGIEEGLRGEPHRGPGTYDPDPVSLFLHPLNAKPRSTKGFYFGATSAQRLPKGVKGIKPGPADYQTVELDKREDGYKPFGSAIERLPEDTKNKTKPGPGSHQHDVPMNRSIEFDESFGGKKILRDVVMMKCNNGIPDKCYECDREPTGDYFESKSYALCPDCFKTLQGPAHDKLRGFSKVRDCTGVHKHEFPGKSPKTIVKTEKELKKRTVREAYLRQYYS